MSRKTSKLIFQPIDVPKNTQQYFQRLKRFWQKLREVLKNKETVRVFMYKIDRDLIFFIFFFPSFWNAQIFL